MPDDKPSRFAMTPIEKNARRLIGVLLQYFPGGGTSTDLLRRFQTEASLARQSFYSALAYCKKQGWIIKGERDRLYKASPDGAWREEPIASIGASIGAGRDKDQLTYLIGTQTQLIQGLQSEIEQLRDWSNSSDVDGGSFAVQSLLKIVSDSAASARQRIKAAGAILGYKVQDEGVVEFTKRFLQSVCVSTDIATDYKIEAGELLRKHEAPRVMSEIVRPNYQPEEPPGELPIPLKELVRQRRERADRMQREMVLQMEREMALRSGATADTDKLSD